MVCSHLFQEESEEFFQLVSLTGNTTLEQPLLSCLHFQNLPMVTSGEAERNGGASPPHWCQLDICSWVLVTAFCSLSGTECPGRRRRKLFQHVKTYSKCYKHFCSYLCSFSPCLKNTVWKPPIPADGRNIQKTKKRGLYAVNTPPFSTEYKEALHFVTPEPRVWALGPQVCFHLKACLLYLAITKVAISANKAICIISLLKTQSFTKKTTFFMFTIKQNGIKKVVEKTGRKKSLIPIQRDLVFTGLEDCTSLAVTIGEGRSFLEEEWDLIFI